MNSERSSAPPEEPLNRSNPALLSPASPKPIHFPAPTNIPVLQMQTDVDFNQTEIHMSDPGMRNTEVRPDFWRDPNEQQDDDHASPFSTGGDVAEAAQDESAAKEAELLESGAASDSKDTEMNGSADPEPVQLSNEASPEANASLETPSAPEAGATSDAPQPTPSEPSMPTAVPETSATSDAAAEEASPEQVQPAVPALNGNVDVQALLDTLQVPHSATSTAANNANPFSSPSQSQPSAPGLEQSPSSAAGLTVPPSGLPARPPPQEQPLIHPNYVHSQHIRDYHPHAAHPAFQPGQHVRTGSQGNTADPSTRNFVPPAPSPSQPNSATTPQQAYYDPTSAISQHPPQSALQTPVSAYSAYQQSAAGGYPVTSPTGASFGAAGAQGSTASFTTPIESRRERKLAAGEVPAPEDRPWNADIQAKYDRFIETERHYVSEGRWEQFPFGSRLFVGTRNLDGSKTRKDEVTLVDEDKDGSADGSFLLGNLSSEKVTKRDIFHVFHAYGELAQISIKQAYGFVQFLTTEECKRALEGEQGTQIRDKRIHLEISKPQKNRPQNQNQNQVRRSRSPVQDYGRGGKPAPGVDRYAGGRGSGYNRQGGFRSPSPPRGGYRDRYDNRYRERSPDYGRRGGNGRYRSPSPRRSMDDDLPLPRRAPNEVPDVQIIVLDSLERDFIGWVENHFKSRGVRAEVLLLSPRLDEQAVVKRQIVEGVVAVVKLTKANQNTGRIGMQVFNRSGGGGSVSFEEYDNLDPSICVELVLRAKQTHTAPTPAPAYGGAYGGGGYGAQPPAMPPQQQQSYGAYGQAPAYGQQPPAPTGYPPGYTPQQTPGGQQPPQNLQNLITSLDPNGLQSLLSAMHQSPNTPQTAGSATYGTPQSAGYPPQGQYGHQQQQQAAIAALQQNPQMAAGLQQAAAAPSGQQGGQVNMQDILARLGNYKQ